VPTPTLTIPLQIWGDSTPEERDQWYLDAGFQPEYQIIDNGSDSVTIRLKQVIPNGPEYGGGLHELPVPVPDAGDDLRDYPQGIPISLEQGGNGAGAGFGQAGTAIAIAGRALKLILGGGGGRLTAAIWNSLPSLVRSALVQVGIGVGALVAFNGDIPFITLPGQNPDTEVTPYIPPEATIDIQVGANPLQPVQVVGSWVANGVTFYRLASGKLAVQNKKGRWKVWRPKRPIVLYSDGASNLKTMLRADKALNKQAKKIAAMLNRRAGTKPRAKKEDPKTIIIQGSGRVVDT